MRLPEAFDLFINERRFITNVSPKTVEWYKNSWLAFARHINQEATLDQLDAAQLKAAVIGMASSGRKAVSVNTHLRAINAWLNWCHKEGLIDRLLKAKRLIVEQTLPPVLTDDQIKALLAFQPKGFTQRRTHTLALLILDSGLRLSECLTVERDGLDFDQATVTVLGKGRKSRTVPLSRPMLGHLFRWLRQHRHNLVFPKLNGGPMKPRAILANFKTLQRGTGINNVRFSPHTLRHSMASGYIRNGGDAFRLQRILGHSTLEMTRRYVQLQTSDLSAVHDSLSVLSVGANSRRR